MARHAIALLLVAGVLPLGCSNKGSGDAPPPPATTAAPTAAAPAPTASAAAAPTATAAASAAKAEPPVYPPKKVAGGMLNGMWVQPFEIVRDKGNLGLSYLDAMNRCVGYGKVLCTDSQWQRACDADAKLAEIETWTVSGVGNNKFVVRGGDEAGCRARDVKEGTDLSPARAAVCCDPTIAIKSSRQDALYTATIKKLYAYQAAMRTKDTLALTDAYEDKVTFLGEERTRNDIIKMHEESFQKDPAQWTVFDTCTVAFDLGAGGAGASDAGADDAGAGDAGAGANATATADCRTLFQRNGSVVVAMQRLVWGGPGMKIKLIGNAVTAGMPSPDGAVIEEKELKERVGILLSAD